MMIQAVLSNPSHPEYGVATIPFPIPHDQYTYCMELLKALEIGDAVKADCKVEKIDSFYTVLKRAEMLKRAAVYLAGTGRMPQQFSTVADVLRQMCQRRIRVFFSKGRVAGFQRRHGTLGHITLKPTLVVKSLAGIPVGHRRDPPLQKNAGFPKKTSGDPAEMKMR